MPVAQDNHLLVPEGIPVLLRDLIHERLGTYFDESRFDTMLDKLEAPARARNCRSILDYYYLLKYDQDGHQEWERVMDALSVQETYFWREMGQVRLLCDQLVPQWFRKSSLPLQIWSAACATGAETGAFCCTGAKATQETSATAAATAIAGSAIRQLGA